jgi:hypothetical protein
VAIIAAHDEVTSLHDLFLFVIAKVTIAPAKVRGRKTF